MYANASSDGNRRSLMAIMPYCAACYNFLQDDRQIKKSAWLVPHVIRHKDDSELISWRCNWGGVCESDCIYAMARDRVERTAPAPSAAADPPSHLNPPVPGL
jgi:hypothetical protein